MQETASQAKRSTKPEPAPDEIPSLAFADADGAKRWAKSLMITAVTPLYEAVRGQLRALSAADFAPRERATIAEVMREQVAHLHTELARRYAGKPQPAADRELESAEQAISLWQGLWEQYSACLKPLLEGDIELQGVKAKLLQRGLYVGKQLVIVYGLTRRIRRPRCGRSCTPTIDWPSSSIALSPRYPTSSCRTRWASRVTRRTATRCC